MSELRDVLEKALDAQRQRDVGSLDPCDFSHVGLYRTAFVAGYEAAIARTESAELAAMREKVAAAKGWMTLAKQTLVNHVEPGRECMECLIENYVDEALAIIDGPTEAK